MINIENLPFLYHLTNIEILIPNKVIRWTFIPSIFTSNTNGIIEIKTICHEDDAFDLSYALRLAYAKAAYRKILTPIGIENAVKLTYNYKIYDKAMKEVKNFLKEQEREAKAKKELAAARKRQAEKKARKKAERRQKRIEAIAAKAADIQNTQ